MQLVSQLETDDEIAFSQASDHRGVIMQWLLTAAVLPFFIWLTYVGWTRGNVLWASMMTLFILAAAYGLVRSFIALSKPFEYFAAFDRNELRTWDSRDPGKMRVVARVDITQVLIERPNTVSYGIRTSRMAQGIPGIWWTAERLDALERFLTRHWPDVRLDKL